MVEYVKNLGIYMYKYYCFILITLLSFSTTTIEAKNIPIFAGKNAPFNFMHKGSPSGITVKILEEVFKKENFYFNAKEIELNSWSSVFSQAIVTPNSLLITASRIPEREELFQWVGPIANVRLVIVAKKNTISIKDLKDIQKFDLASSKNTSAERAYIDLGGDVSNVSRLSTPKQGYRMLEYGRVDALICTDLPFVYDLVKHGKNVNDYEIVYILKKTDYYIAAHKSMPKNMIKILQNGLDKLKEKRGDNPSTYDLIFAKYFKGAILSVKNNK